MYVGLLLDRGQIDARKMLTSWYLDVRQMLDRRSINIS